MAIFLMIHGAWHGGWCFEPLRPSLEHRGHTLLAPTFPGMGGHDVPAQDVTLSLRADSVTESDQHALFQGVAPAVEDSLYLVPKVIE